MARTGDSALLSCGAEDTAGAYDVQLTKRWCRHHGTEKSVAVDHPHFLFCSWNPGLPCCIVRSGSWEYSMPFDDRDKGRKHILVQCAYIMRALRSATSISPFARSHIHCLRGIECMQKPSLIHLGLLYIGGQYASCTVHSANPDRYESQSFYLAY